MRRPALVLTAVLVAAFSLVPATGVARETLICAEVGDDEICPVITDRQLARAALRGPGLALDLTLTDEGRVLIGDGAVPCPAASGRCEVTFAAVTVAEASYELSYGEGLASVGTALYPAGELVYQVCDAQGTCASEPWSPATLEVSLSWASSGSETYSLATSANDDPKGQPTVAASRYSQPAAVSGTFWGTPLAGSSGRLIWDEVAVGGP